MSLFQRGDTVVRRNRRDERGTVCGPVRRINTQNFYNVRFDSASSPVLVPETDLDSVEPDMTLEERLRNREFGDKSTFSRLLTFERLRHPLQDTLYSLRASRTEFQAYQFKPLLKFLRSSKQRLLLADEVGLGKTIEAGFILCELLARHPHSFRRALVVCKASLCIKWQMELRKRFDQRFEIWRADDLREFLRRYREDEDLELKAICSLESFRNTALMQEWEAMPPALDFLAIDEAHHLKNSETKAHKACRTAAESADAVVALTATPIQMGSRDLFNLLSLLDEEEFASFPYFEACMLFNQHMVAAEQKVAQTDPGRFAAVHEILTTLADGGNGLFQRSATRSYQSSLGELLAGWVAVRDSLLRNPLYRETLRLLCEADPSSRQATVEIQRNLAELNFLSRVFSRTRRRDVHVGTVRQARVQIVTMTPAEHGLYQAVLGFVRESYAKEGKDVALLFGLMMPQRQLASCIPAMVEYYESKIGSNGAGLDEEESDADAEDWNTRQAVSDERYRQLWEVIQTWRREKQPDSKFAVLKECLEELQREQPGEPIVIFSYFKKTLEYLSRRLHALGYSNTVISGAFTPAEREQRIAYFRQGKYQILLSTEVGSEGLDFQFCHILFNYDLPWNPMVVEQRIGRLDRFGQQAEKILIFNFSSPGTIEDEILRRLYSRINLFEQYIGDLEAIIGEEITKLTKELFNPELSEQQRNERIEQAGLLLEKRKQQFEEWEKASPQFVGHDEYYRQEVDRAQMLGRFIRPQDLCVLLEDFLTQFDRKSNLVDEGSGVYLLEGGPKLVQFVLSQPEDAQKAAFNSALQRNSLRITFDPEVAEQRKDVIFVHVRHFFVRAIVNEYQRGHNHFHPVACVSLPASAELPAGDYLYMLARATIRAARPQEAMLPVVVDLYSLNALDEDTGEVCLSRMVSEGGDGDPAGLSANRMAESYGVAEAVVAERFQRRRESTERLNEAFVEARLSSVRESYNLKIARKRKLLENARAKRQQASYIRMLEGGIRNLEAEQQSKEKEIESKRVVTAEHSIVAVGSLRVREMGGAG